MTTRLLQAEAKDSSAMLVAIGLLAYASADVAHHALGHGVACLLAGGQLEKLSSVVVKCSCTGVALDLAGPLANLLLGAAALLAGRFATPTGAATRLLVLLTAGFNLLYFAGQLLYGAATYSDDWWWPLRQAHVPAIGRYALAAGGLGLYVLAMRLVAWQLSPFAAPQGRATKLVGVAWVAAGVLACATAAFDHPAGTAILQHAVPQALLLPAGLWLLPARAAQQVARVEAAPGLVLSWPWVVAALAAGLASLWWLGPGVSLR